MFLVCILSSEIEGLRFVGIDDDAVGSIGHCIVCARLRGKLFIPFPLYLFLMYLLIWYF
jgi:hypothetical protein